MKTTISSGASRIVTVVALDGRTEGGLLELIARAMSAGGAGGSSDQPVAVGPSAVMDGIGVSTAALQSSAARLERHGQQPIFVALDGRLAGLLGIAVADPNHQLSSTVREAHMRDLLSSAAQFPREIDGLSSAGPVELIDLADADRFDLRIAPVVKQIGDHAVRMLTYNGSVPGPTLRVRQGSRIQVHVANEGDIEATVHWHGLRLDNRFDGTAATQRPIREGESFTYTLDFPDAGIYWYHPHIREDYTQEMGLYGAVVVTPAEADYWPRVNRELVFTLDDVLIEQGKIAAFDRTQPTHSAMGRFGNILLINGEPSTAFGASRNEVVRCYFVNTANTRVFNVGFRGARMKLVGGDSGRYERETFVDSVLLAPSERVVVDVLFDEPGETILEHRTPGRVYSLGTVRVAATTPDTLLVDDFNVLRINQELAEARARVTPFIDATPDKGLSLIAEMDLGTVAAGIAGYACPMHPEVRSSTPDRCPHCGMKLVPASLVGDTGHAMGDDHEHEHHHTKGEFPEGIEWEDDMVDVNRMTTAANTRWKLIDRATGASGSAIDWQFRVGDRVKIRLVNEMDSDHPMHHPFHIHGAGRFLVLSRDGVVEPNLVWKDTVLVPTGQTVDILLEVTNAGVWMAHCHISEHHESGMMFSFRVAP